MGNQSKPVVKQNPSFLGVNVSVSIAPNIGPTNTIMILTAHLTSLIALFLKARKLPLDCPNPLDFIGTDQEA